MANIIDSLFGPTPYDVGQQRNQQDMSYAEKVARMGGFEQAKFGIGQGAAGLTRAGAGMMGMVDPLQQEAAMREGVMAQGGDLTTSAGLKAKAMQFAQAGDQRTAMKLAIAAKQQEVQEQEMALKRAQELAALHKANAESSPFAKINPKDYTPASLKAYMLSKNPSDLVAFDEEKNPNSYKEYVLAKEANPSIEPYDKWLLSHKKAGATKVENILPGSEHAIDIPKFENSAQSTIKPHLEVVTAADMATAALKNSIKTGNFASFNAAKQQLARAFSDGTISRSEVESAGGDPSMIGGIVDTTSKLFTGTPSEDTQRRMLETLAIAKRVASSKGKMAVSRMRKVGEMSKLTPAQLDALLTFPEFDDATGTTVASDDALIQKHLKKKP